MLIYSFLLTCVLGFTFYNQINQGNAVNSVHFSPDGTLLALGMGANTHNIYSFATLTVVDSFNAGSQSKSVKFSPNQQFIGYALSNYSLVLRNIDYTSNITITSKFNTINQIDFNSNSDKVILCGQNSSKNGYQIWSVQGSLLNSDYTFGSSALCCRFSKNGSYAVGDSGGNVKYYSDTFALQWNHLNTSSSGRKTESLAFASDSILSTGWGSNLQAIITFSGLSSNSSSSFISRGSDILSLDYTDDGLFLAAGDDNDKIRVYDVADNYNSPFNADLGSNVDKVDFSQNGCYLVCAAGNKAHIYNARCNIPKNPPVGPPIRCPIDQYLNSSTMCRPCVLDMKGCRKCSSETVCLVCTDQYYLNSSNKCSPCTQINPACTVCDNSNTCKQCLGSYYLNGSNCSLCYSAIPGCIFCLNASACLACSHSFYFNSGGSNCLPCSSALSNCISCNSSTACIECQSSYFIDTGGACSKCSSKCSTCVTNSLNCLSCSQGYYLSGSNCLSCPWNCVNCTGPSTCSMCVAGYYLLAGTCTPCSSLCQTCVTSNSNCLSCNVGYYLNVNTCTLCSLNCASCVTTANYCLSCNIGYYLDTGANSCISCKSIDSKCSLCNSSICLQCVSGYFLNSSSKCQNCDLIAGCQVCSNSSSCLVCSSRYYLSGSSCTPCSWPCLNCANSTKCLGCAIGYYLDSSTSACLKCNCPTCNSSTNCLSCPIGSYLNLGSCLPCNSIHSMCRSCKDSATCLDCTPPFYLNGLSCSLCPANCSSCSSSLICKTCVLGYYLSTTTCSPCPAACSTCVSASNCTQCINGYYVSSGSCLACSTVSTGCDSCNSTACLSCSYIEGYYLSSNLCSTCSSAISNCLKCTVNNNCAECLPSFTLNNTNLSCVSCSALIPSCQICSSKTNCTRCLSGYYANGAACSPCSNGCFSCDSAAVCRKCFTRFLLTPTFTCTQCASVLLGCTRCSSLSDCIQCDFGYYISGNACLPCLASLNGCLACNASNICIQCQNGYYLNSTLNTCQLCASNLTGCGFCRSSGTCDICLSGYYLSIGQCQLCSTPNCLTCNLSQCNQCISGYYLNGGSCGSCSSLFSGCIMCNSSACQTCSSGYYSTGNTCGKCNAWGCQLCNNTNSSQCLSCSSTYYLNSGTCRLCQSTLLNCIKCDAAGATCTVCKQGYYINGGNCALCSSALTNCLSCSSNSLCKSCDSGSILVSSSCTLCNSLMDGCLFCQSSSSCLNCMQGYYLNASGLCQRCGQMQGCLICRNAKSCSLCTSGYFLQNGLCLTCNTTMNGCIACSSNATCLACQGNYSLGVTGCTIIKPTTNYYPYKQLGLKSKYVSATTLKHTLLIYGQTFRRTNLNLGSHSNISYVVSSGEIVLLTISGFQIGPKGISIIFYTNNPFNLTKNVSTMKLFNMRLLGANHLDQFLESNDAQTTKNTQLEGQKVKRLIIQRRLQQQNISNLDINANFMLNMDQEAVLAILPRSLHGGDLFLSYNTNKPEFLSSTLVLYDYKYHYFGEITSVCLLIYYFVKGVVIDVNGKDKGQLVAHIFFTKTPVLMLFPAFAELIDYCRGFMFADLPWLNSFFASLFSDPRDSTPQPYLVFYQSLSIASTFLLPIAFMIICYLTLKAVSCLGWVGKIAIKNTTSVIYSFFLGGISFAAAGCVQGAFLNPMANNFTISSAFYLSGLILFVSVVMESVWSTYQDKHNAFKIRIIVKATLLSVLHYNPLYLLALVLGAEAFFMVLKIRLQKLSHPSLWLFANILPNLSLLMLIQLSHSLVSIYVSAILIVCSVAVEIIITVKNYKLNKIISEVKINYKEVDQSIMKTMQVFMDNEGKVQNIFNNSQQSDFPKEKDLKQMKTQQKEIENIENPYFFTENEIIGEN